ncbi:hypothetical protein FB451DRAFT_362507 [Mycena latifolia]|nr:hypothetical protein FB451DRAFT_362507 [Mycena latifolia]
MSSIYTTGGYQNRILLCGLVLGGLPGIYAQPGPTFEWGFTGTQASSTSLPSCQSLPIQAGPLTANGIPPFYMIAFAVDGAPITSFIGTNESNLTWQVRHPVGTKLLLGVVDSQGTSGGIDTPMYTVTEGASTACILTAAAEPEFKVTANVTDALSTCQQWGLTIQGGTPPYNLTLAALNAVDVTNVTLGPNDSVYTYINRAEPDTQMIAAVSDLNGRWATGSPLVRTQGSANFDCGGLVSSSSGAPPSSSSEPPSTTSSATSPSMSRARIGTIAGAAVGGLILACGAIAFAIYLCRRRRSRPRITNIAPLHVGPSHDVQMSTAGYLPAAYTSRPVAQAGSYQAAPLLAVSESSSSPASSPDLLPRGRELPPPYSGGEK